MAVFPCGAALTVLGTLTAEAVRTLVGAGHSWHKLHTLWIPAAWAGAGVLGFISLIHGVDRLMTADRRLPWYVLLGILFGIAAAGFFSVTYPLRSSSALFLRIVCVTPVAVEALLLIYHLGRYLRNPPAVVQPPVPAPPTSSSPADGASPR